MVPYFIGLVLGKNPSQAKDWIQVRRRPRPGQRKPTTTSYFPTFGLKVLKMIKVMFLKWNFFKPPKWCYWYLILSFSGASTETSKAPSTSSKTRGKNCKRLCTIVNESSIRATSQNPTELRAPSSWQQEEFRPEGRNVISLFHCHFFGFHINYTNPAATCRWDRRHVLGTRQIWTSRAICEWPNYFQST